MHRSPETLPLFSSPPELGAWRAGQALGAYIMRIKEFRVSIVYREPTVQETGVESCQSRTVSCQIRGAP